MMYFYICYYLYKFKFKFSCTNILTFQIFELVSPHPFCSKEVITLIYSQIDGKLESLIMRKVSHKEVA